MGEVSGIVAFLNVFRMYHSVHLLHEQDLVLASNMKIKKKMRIKVKLLEIYIYIYIYNN